MKATKCRLCKGENLVEWLNLGHHPHSDQFHKEIEPEMRYPLGVSICQDCKFNQLTWIVAKEELYLKDYLYESSITKTADAHWQEFAETVTQKIGLKEHSFVIDIGGNDGTLLTKFKTLGHDVLNIDPTPEATQIAIDRGIPTAQEFFSSKIALPIYADLIVGANVFAHVDDLDDFMAGVKRNLAEGGVFIFESPYFGSFLKGLEADTVYHQHLSYLSLAPLIPFFAKHGMEVFHVEQRDLHGGAFRVYIARTGERTVDGSVQQMLDGETWTMQDLEDFTMKFNNEVTLLVDFIIKESRKGKTFAVISTPAKGNTFLNYAGIGRYIAYATDKSKLKQGRYTPGTFIPVKSDDEILKNAADYNIILAWNFAQEIINNNPDYHGKWIIPLPKFTVYEP